MFTLLKIAQARLRFVDFDPARTLSRVIGSIMVSNEIRPMAYFLLNRTRRFPGAVEIE